MVILILGGTGQLGRPIAEGLAEAGYDVVVTGRREVEVAGCEFFKFEVGVDGVGVLPGCDVLINCVGIFVERRGASFEGVHVGLVKDLILERGRMGYGKFVQLSALGARVDGCVAFLRSKGRAEKLIEQGLDDYLILRPSIVCTAGTRLIRNLDLAVGVGRWLGGVPMMGGEEMRVQPIGVDDLVGIVLVGVTRGEERLRIDCVGGEVFGVCELVEMVMVGKGVKRRILRLPGWLMFVAGFVVGCFDKELLSVDQVRLLGIDNVGEVAGCEELLGREMAGVREFWMDSGNY